MLLAIIGPRWLSACDEDGHRRLDSTNDFVRIEIATALNRGITVIPILCDGMQVPKANQLPDDLKALATRNGLHVRNDAFHVDMDRLILELKEASIDSNGYDVSIAYCRGDGTPLAKWLKWRLQKFVLPDKIPRVIPPHRKTVYDRGPSIFLDTSVKSSDDWLQHKIFPALDNSDRLIVILTSLAFDDKERLMREIDRFFARNEEISTTRPVELIFGPNAEERFPERLIVFKNFEWIDFRQFSWWHRYGISSQLDSEIKKIIAWFYEVPDRDVPML